MATPGALLYKFKQTFEHGIDTAYYREIFRKEILKTKPIESTKSRTVEVHTLTSSKDWLNTLWSVKTFYFYSQADYSLCIHDDGSLSEIEISEIKKHFPNSKIVMRGIADETLEQQLENYPRSLRLRKSNPFSLKVFDFANFATAEKIISIDSDILFFASPKNLLARIDSPAYQKNTLNCDWNYGYSPSIERLQKYVDFPVIPYINSGLGLLHKASINFDKIEEFLEIPEILSHSYGGRSEQTLIALSSCRFGFEFLPQEYDVHLEATPPGVACRHYVSPIRYLMYQEGLRRLIQKDFLNQMKS